MPQSRQKIVGFLATGTAQRQDNGTRHTRRYGDTSSDWEHEQQPESTCYGSQRNQRLQARELGSAGPQQGIENPLQQLIK